MATMIPDRLPHHASMGEKWVFTILQRLSDENIVYYEPIIADRYPDFILISPELGVLVIEVKGWLSKDILGADTQNVQIKERSGVVSRCHPSRQARDYMNNLMEECQKSANIRHILQTEGSYQNRLICPMSHVAILSKITTEELREHKVGDLTSVFKLDRVITRDFLDRCETNLYDPDEIVNTLRRVFDPWWQFPKLTENQVDALRAVIHPEVVLQPFQNIEEDSDTSTLIAEINLKVLDSKQEDNARNIGRGHRVIYGVAGSGKTVLLIARAKLISEQWPESEILFICYNVLLATYLRSVLSDYSNVTVCHFDEWSKKSGIVRLEKRKEKFSNLETNSELGERLLQALEEGTKESRKYDAVLIDEAQDFGASWFKCALEAMKDPHDGDLTIVGDGAQGLYQKREFTWKDVGVNAVGRTLYRNLNLDENYRNSLEIIKLAEIFSVTQEGDGEDTMASLKVRASNCQRITGILPVLVKARSEREECSKAINIIRDLLAGSWFGMKVDALRPQDIGVFYRSVAGYKKDLLPDFIKNLQEFTPVCWLQANRRSRTRISEPAVKVQTIHSAKGLQYPAVIILWAGDMPANFSNITPEAERNLFYVALTRPETYLAICTSSSSDFVNKIEQSEQAIIV